jgi:ArsR family transcriptional regulator, arsenate/arsenite/antimonite-responsive transcriptional repressor
VTNASPLLELPLVDELEACCPALLTAPISEPDAELAARVFKALADPARVRILSLIAAAGERGACVCELVLPIELSQPTVSHHLKKLHDARLVSRERRGTWIYYRLREESLGAVARALSV